MAERVPEEIRRKLPLESLVEQSGFKLVRQNSRYAYFVCGFHADTNPSFVVDKTYQTAKCYSPACKELGKMDHVSFIQNHEHLPREMAIDFLYKAIGEPRPIDSDYDVMRRVAEILQTNVNDDRVTTFFGARGITPAALQRLMVGYSPSYQWFKEAIKDIPPDQAGRLELMRPELFNNVIVYPVFDAMGRVAGFRNRSFGTGPKYVANTTKFKLPSARLYGLHLVKKGQRQIILVEGSNDVLGLHSAGIPNVAGVLGSNLNGIDKYLEEHGFTDIVFIADGDSPGWNAALQAPDMIRVTQIPVEGMDPDEFAHTKGTLPILDLIEKARYPIEIRLDAWLAKAPSSITQKISLIKQLTRELSSGMPPILLAVIRERISTALSIPPEDVDMIFSMVDLDTDQLEYKIVYHLYSQGSLSDDIKMMVTSNMFYNRQARQAMEQLNKGLSLTETPPKADGLTRGDIDKFVDMSKRRQVRQALNKISAGTANLSDPIDSLISRAVGKLVDSAMESVEVIDGTELLKIGLINVNERVTNPGKIDISFGQGFPTLDRVLQGIRPNSMNVLAGTQGTGKSALAFDWALDIACKQQIPILWVSLEMSRAEMADRALAKLSGVDATKINMGNLSDTELKLVRESALQYTQSPLYYVDTGVVGINQIVALARKLKITKGIRMVFIDYLQLVEGGSRDQSMYERVGYISRMIKSGICMDRSIGVPVMALAQLSKLAAKVELPTAEHIAESYKIAQDADCFLAIHRRNQSEINDDQLSGENWGNMLMHIAKNRAGQSMVKVGMVMNMNNLCIREAM